MNLPQPTRRALARKYKDTPLPAGVIAITNTLNGRIYLAGSLHVEAALSRARFELGLRSHRNKALVRDWIEHGAAHFRFEVMDRVKQSDDPAFDLAAELENLLALWRDELQCGGERGYNAR